MNIKPGNSAALSSGLPSGNTSRFAIIGGFLGAGKTTCLNQFASWLKMRGCHPAIIVNGQSQDLVDTTTFRSHGWTTEQINGGCLSSRFTSLAEAAERLLASRQTDTIIVEPAGTCTDLQASVAHPLRKTLGDRLTLSPLSVVIDPARASTVLGIDQRARNLSPNIAYIYEKQLEEADILVINKIDIYPADLRAKIRSALQTRFPNRTILEVSARTGEGLDPWFEKILGAAPGSARPIQINYDTYADAESSLGWFNGTVGLSSRKYFDSSKVLVQLATAIQAQLKEEGAEVAHLKMSLNPDDEIEGLGLLSLVRNDHVPELAEQLSEPIESGRLTINLRAEANPELLNSAVNRALLAVVDKTPHLFARMEYSEHFRPTAPQPAQAL